MPEADPVRAPPAACLPLLAKQAAGRSPACLPLRQYTWGLSFGARPGVYILNEAVALHTYNSRVFLEKNDGKMAKSRGEKRSLLI